MKFHSRQEFITSSVHARFNISFTDTFSINLSTAQTYHKKDLEELIAVLTVYKDKLDE